MSDYISRQAAIEALKSEPIGKMIISKYNMDGWLEGLPAADVVEVVRCKDCKHLHKSLANGTPFETFCDVFPTYIHEDDFCSYGERADK